MNGSLDTMVLAALPLLFLLSFGFMAKLLQVSNSTIAIGWLKISGALFAAGVLFTAASNGIRILRSPWRRIEAYDTSFREIEKTLRQLSWRLDRSTGNSRRNRISKIGLYCLLAFTLITLGFFALDAPFDEYAIPLFVISLLAAIVFLCERGD
jgi:hypothetical protein